MPAGELKEPRQWKHSDRKEQLIGNSSRGWALQIGECHRLLRRKKLERICCLSSERWLVRRGAIWGDEGAPCPDKQVTDPQELISL